MVLFCFKIISIIFTLTTVSVVYSEYYTKKNATNKFHYYQLKFNRQYENREDKKRAFNNFLRNLNTVSDLNEKFISNTTMYVINKYADTDQEDIEEQYGVKVLPYDNVRDPEKAIRTGHEDNTTFVENTKLHDLNNAAELYEEYKKKFNRTNVIKKRDDTIRYYRFVKTLVEINENNMKGKPPIELDDKADVVKEPLEYFY